MQLCIAIYFRSIGERLCSKGAIPSSMTSCLSLTSCPHIIHKSLVVVTTLKTRTSFLGKNVFCHLRNSGRHSRNPHIDILRCDWWTHESSIQLPRDFPGICVRISSKVCGKPAKERVFVAPLRSAIFCDAHEVPMDGCLFSGDLFGPSSLSTAKHRIKIASAFSDVVVTQNPLASSRGAVPRYSANSQIYGACNNRYHAEYILGPPTQPLIKLSFRGAAKVLQRMNLLHITDSHIEKRRVIVHSSKPKPWWKQVLFQQLDEEEYGFDPEDGSERGSDMEDGEFAEDVSSGTEENFDEDDVDTMLSDDQKFNSWQQKRFAIDELREYQETGRDPDNRDWEDWLDDSWGDYSQYVGSKDGGWYAEQSEWEKGGIPREPPNKPERGMNRTIKELLLRIFETQEEVEDDLNFEERVFRFTSQSTAKFVTILILVPWAVDFLVHDYLMVPFLRRWVEEVPLAAEVLDVKESQKLHMIERLKLERQRVRFEAEIGKAPPLSDEELNEHIRDEALELRENLREENRSAFANIWSDAVAGFSVLLLLVFNPHQVAIMRMTGDRLFTNISDTGKAFIIILCTDIFLGYHSESGWETVIEILLDHYGLEVSQGSIYIFVAIVPVTIDACFKLWVFRYLTRLSPSAAATFREMKRH